MRRIDELLRLQVAAALSNRGVARSVGISRSTVKEYLQRAALPG